MVEVFFRYHTATSAVARQHPDRVLKSGLSCQILDRFIVLLFVTVQVFTGLPPSARFTIEL